MDLHSFYTISLFIVLLINGSSSFIVHLGRSGQLSIRESRNCEFRVLQGSDPTVQAAVGLVNGCNSPTSLTHGTFPGPSLHKRRPPPGHSGWEYDSKGRNSDVTVYYGDIYMRHHMGHVERSRRKHRDNRRSMPLSSNPAKNREIAMLGAPPRRPGKVNDEKPPAMVDNNPLRTTVEQMPGYESSGRGQRPDHERPTGRMPRGIQRKDDGRWNYSKEKLFAACKTTYG